MLDWALGGTVGWAFAAGVMTFFAPCSYPLLPGYVGFYVAQQETDAPLAGVAARGAAAGLGVFSVVAVISAAAVFVDGSQLEYISVFEPLVGVVFLLAGVAVLSGVSSPVSVPLPKRRASVLGFWVFGAGYGLAAVACLAPVFLSVLVQGLALPAPEATLVVGAYGGATAGLLTLATVAIAVGVDTWEDRTGWLMRHSKQIAGVLLVAAGIGQLLLAASDYGGF
ncbi:homolog to cytochrome c-type biogenesis protein CcdA [Natronomonas pharaonis DSM 2160]|uniref:Homolog to cytochrome c-type biogenesis protein CcdA n=1 Tax=Natronomonas pharaonis (strain ATCC 35678 / DSM 2160 / CIP 103997 / JCM 8858 / NBRC 14720 / NCIMB 2260 / Gabara) TaxID=348780 RepID=A0A1U7EXV7_NATPD|nr:cytochrome c biogenesis protein CcdA [Natronomonas pharaonis]CAI50047.1 homolog to cytochrome c-type biogenesis protein CcdA [Natronomonas pharaonis DSM 2160]